MCQEKLTTNVTTKFRTQRQQRLVKIPVLSGQWRTHSNYQSWRRHSTKEPGQDEF